MISEREDRRMAKPTVVKMSQPFTKRTVTVRVHCTRGFWLRFYIGKALLWLGIRIMGGRPDIQGPPTPHKSDPARVGADLADGTDEANAEDV